MAFSHRQSLTLNNIPTEIWILCKIKIKVHLFPHAFSWHSTEIKWNRNNEKKTRKCKLFRMTRIFRNDRHVESMLYKSHAWKNLLDFFEKNLYPWCSIFGSLSSKIVEKKRNKQINQFAGEYFPFDLRTQHYPVDRHGL